MKFFFKSIFIIALLHLFVSCNKKTDRLNNEKIGKEFNTKITINFYNLISNRGLYFQSYDTLPFKSDKIIKAPNYKITRGKNSITYEFYLKKKRDLLLGFSKFHIQPNDEINLNYVVFKDDKYFFEDKFDIIGGNAVLLLQNGSEVVSVNPNLANSFLKSRNKKVIDSFLNITFFNGEAQKVIRQMKLEYLSTNKRKTINDYLTNYYANKYLFSIISNPNFNKLYLDKELQDYVNKKIGFLIAHYNKPSSVNFDFYAGWNSLDYYFKTILNNKLSIEGYKIDMINQELKHFDDNAKQFLYLKIAENILKEPQYDKKNFNAIINAITYTPFKNETKKFIAKNQTGNYADGNLKNITFYDTNLKLITFEKIFLNTTQKYIYFDFCGSWCLPCIQEIKAYSKNKKFENSKTMRPVWIFFEKDQKAWFKIIDKYNLKKENCFLINNNNANEFMKNFGLKYNWKGEFPHHSLFNRNGTIKEENPNSLEKLDETSLK